MAVLKMSHYLNSLSVYLQIFQWLCFNHMNSTFFFSCWERKRERRSRDVKRDRRERVRVEGGREWEREKEKRRKTDNLKRINYLSGHFSLEYMGWSDLEMTEVNFPLFHSSPITQNISVIWASSIYRHVIFTTWLF